MGRCIFVSHNIRNYIWWNILEKGRIYLRQYIIICFMQMQTTWYPKNSQLNIKIFSFYNKDKTTDRTLLTKETELSKLSHNIVILNTDQLTFPLYTSMKDSITTTKVQIQSLQTSSAHCQMNQESINTFSIQIPEQI